MIESAGEGNSTTSASVDKGAEPLDTLQDALAACSQPEPVKEEPLADRALKFLSTTSNEALGGIALVMAAGTYMVLGSVGLALIGAIGGAYIHATWEAQTTLPGAVPGEARRERGIDVMNRVLDLLDQRKAVEEGQDEGDDGKFVARGFDDFQPETAAALNDLVDAVIRDYIKWWYGPILPTENTFPAASRQTLTSFLLKVSTHFSRKKPTETFLDFLTNSASIMIVFLDELSQAFAATPGANVPAAEVVYSYLSAHPNSNLANVLNKKMQGKKFQAISDDLLKNFLEKQAYDCAPIRAFLREVLAGLVLEMTLKSCSKPEWINGWIVYLLEEGEPDISQAIDAGMSKDTIASAFNGIDAAVSSSVETLNAPLQKINQTKHQKQMSTADAAMNEAMSEAKRLSQMMADDDAKRLSASIDLADRSQSLAGIENSPLNVESDESKDAESDAASDVKTSTSPVSVVTAAARESFTNFDQIVPNATPAALAATSPARRESAPMVLHNANIIIHDDSTPNDKSRIKSKPTFDYLVQIEPESSAHAGWMIVRRYSDFETLHEVLRRIALISGAETFAVHRKILPSWKDHTKPGLRQQLEQYLCEAMSYQTLAESEGMKRFLMRDQQGKEKKIGLGWPTPSTFESMGKGMMDVLTSAPKGAAEGGKTVLGGVTGVFNNIGGLGQKKASNGTVQHAANRSSISILPRKDSFTNPRKGGASEDNSRPSSISGAHATKLPPSGRRSSRSSSIVEDLNEGELKTSPTTSSFGATPSLGPSIRGTPISSPATNRSVDELKLPPPPSDIPDDYEERNFTPQAGPLTEQKPQPSAVMSPVSTPTSASETPLKSELRPRSSASTTPVRARSLRRATVTSADPPALPASQPFPKAKKHTVSFSEEDTRVAVDLIFAVITELYTLSSAWNIRKAFLGAAKTYLLRPGNPSLNSIQQLIQTSVIDANTSDAGIAAHLHKLRENSLPTAEEMKLWPDEMSAADKERLRLKARKMLVERGVPVALTGVMGQAATSEAVGRVFDCLQVEEVARGLIFGLLLQGVRQVTN